MSYAIKRKKFRGDPGLLSAIGAGVSAFASGGGIGGAIQAGGRELGILPATQTVGAPMVLPPPGNLGIEINPPFGGMPGAGFSITGPGGISLDAGVGEVGEAVGMMRGTNGRGAIAPSGYHWNKTGYFLKSGAYVPAGTKLVKNRRRNPLNPRALDRAMGRITSAKRASKKLSRISIRKKC